MRSALSLFLTLLCLAFVSCEKVADEIPVSTIKTPFRGDIKSIYAYNSDTLFATGGGDDYGAILRSVDGGNTWNVLASGFINCMNDIYFINSLEGYAVDKDVLIYKTNDGGLSWNSYSFPVYPLSVNRNLRSISFPTDSSGFICGGKNFGSGLIYRTLDGGTTWSFLEFAHELRGIRFFDKNNGVVCGYGIIMETSDGGDHWNIINSDNEFYTAMYLPDSGPLWMSTFDGGIYQSTNLGKNWSNVHKGLRRGPRYTAFAGWQNQTLGLAGTEGAVLFSKDGGTSWKANVCQGASDLYCLTFLSPTHALAGSRDGKIYSINY